MKHTPWNLDAYRYFYGDATEEYLLVNRPIREFLEKEDKFFLVGAKGLGKTLFLRYKSYRYHEKYGGSLHFNTSHTELTENLNIHPDTFSKEELLQFRDRALWQLIWELSLWVLVFRISNVSINPRLEKLLDNAKQLSTILTRLLNNRRKIEQYRDFVSEFQEQKGAIQSGAIVFIDDVDQTLHDFLIVPHPTDEYFEGRESPSVGVWVNAQMGLIGAIYNINRQNAHIKIYATIRREAFEALDSEMKINYKQHTSILQYEKDEIRAIFEKNIQLIESADLFDRFGGTHIGRFLGFDRVPHRFAIDAQNERRSEDAFDFIYRHTYGRPREIVLIGKQIDDLVSSAIYRDADPEERIEKIRVLVNRESHELMRQYRQEIIPYLSEVKLVQFLERVRSNIITKEDLHRLDVETVKEYYNLGLVGYVRQVNHSGLMKQIFNPPATYNYRTKQPLPETDYFVIHSTMDTMLLEKHTYGHFYNKYNIIGNGYEFYPKTDNLIQRADYYMPGDLSGNRFKSINESAGHSFPLEEIYLNFFKFDESPRRHEKLMTHWKTAGLILGLLGRICYCNLLRRQFGGDTYSIKKEEYLIELGRHHLVRKYNAELSESYSESALDRFMDKLIGRFITLGCYLVLDMRIEWIHELLLTGKFNFTIHSNKDTAFSYLSRSFFIDDLKKEEPRDPSNYEHRQRKQRVFSKLSPFEQEEIRSFIRNASDEVQYLDWIENQDHKIWLVGEVLPRLWMPEP
jgi:hypothetical protein